MATLSNECHISSLLSAFLGEQPRNHPEITTSASRDGNHSTGGLRLWGETGHRKPVFDPTDDRHLVGYFSELFFFPQRYFCRMAENQMVQWKRLVGLSRPKDKPILIHTWSHMHSLYVVINYHYIYIYTIFALVVSDLLQDEKTSWYIIIVDFFQANNGVAKDMLDLQPEVVCRHGCHWWCFWNRVCRCKESPPLVMNVCVGAAETLERVGKYSSSLFWYFASRRDLYHPSLSTVTVFGQDPPYGLYGEGWFFLITMLDLWTVSLSISCLTETIYVYIYMMIMTLWIFKHTFFHYLYILNLYT